MVGRIAAISNQFHNQTHGDRAAFFGFFESVDDPAVAGALIDAVISWARERGFETLRGPMSPSVNDECGVLVEGFDTPPTIMMPHNPPYYGALLEKAGFSVVKNLLAYQGGDLTEYKPVPERLTRATELMRRRPGLTLRPLDMSRFDEELKTVRRLFNAAWSGNWGFVPFTEHEIEHIAAELKPIVIPEMVPIAEKDGEPVGFGVALADLNQVLIRNRSGRFVPGLLRILWALKARRFRRARILLLGVDPEFQGRGIDASRLDQGDMDAEGPELESQDVGHGFEGALGQIEGAGPADACRRPR